MNKKEKISQVTVISGKGGTGKSTIIASVAYQLKDTSILADADVDAPDLYLIFEPKETEKFIYSGLKLAEINKELCTECDICREKCRFEAIEEDYVVNEFKCEGCSFCYHACPEKAIKMVERESGIFMSSDTRIGRMIHARLNPGEESSGLLVAEVRELARKEAEKEKMKLILIDGSPGIGCPVISSLVGSDLAIVVAEPTLSGFHDLKRVLVLLKYFNMDGYVIINRFDINEKISQEIEEFCAKEFPVIEKIPFNRIFTESMIQKKAVLEMHSEEDSVIDIQNKLRNISNFITSHDKILY